MITGFKEFLLKTNALALAVGVIIALCVYLITKAFLKEPPPPATKPCTRCLETIPIAATKCRYCTADL